VVKSMSYETAHCSTAGRTPSAESRRTGIGPVLVAADVRSGQAAPSVLPTYSEGKESPVRVVGYHDSKSLMSPSTASVLRASKSVCATTSSTGWSVSSRISRCWTSFSACSTGTTPSVPSTRKGFRTTGCSSVRAGQEQVHVPYGQQLQPVHAAVPPDVLLGLREVRQPATF